MKAPPGRDATFTTGGSTLMAADGMGTGKVKFRGVTLSAQCEPTTMGPITCSAGDREAQGVAQRVALTVVARSPMQRLAAFGQRRGCRHHPLYADISGDYTRALVSADSADVPALNVFTLRDGSHRHRWSAEMEGGSADPGDDPRGAPDLMPLWARQRRVTEPEPPENAVSAPAFRSHAV